MKVVMYSHDTFGLGHIRRTLLIAQTLSRTFPDLSILILTGSSMIHSMRIPSNIDYIKLPCLTKLSNEHYRPKYLQKCSARVKKLRKEIIFKSIKEIDPDFFLVDKAPIGVMGELLESLLFLKMERPRTRSILGIRDILDHPESVKREWKRNNIYTVLESLYDEIWIYGSRHIMDVANDYDLPSTVIPKVHYFGYLKRAELSSNPRKIRAELGMNDKKIVCTTLGGGGDGHDLARLFLEVAAELSEHEKIGSLVIMGPDFSRNELESLIRSDIERKDTVIMDYTTEILDYMNASDLVVSMAGYNTICEIFSLQKKAIVVPRIQPRTEQLLRAKLFSDLGLLHMIHPYDLTPSVLKEKIMKVLFDQDGETTSRINISLDGLDNIRRRFTELRRVIFESSTSPSSYEDDILISPDLKDVEATQL